MIWFLIKRPGGLVIPRQARLNTPRAFHHVMGRGIERKKDLLK